MDMEHNVSVVPEKWESSFQVWMWTWWRSFYQGPDFPALAAWLQGTSSVNVLYYWRVTLALAHNLAFIPQITSLKENSTFPHAFNAHGIKAKSLSTSRQPALQFRMLSIATHLEGGSKGERQLNKILIDVYLYLYLCNTSVVQKATGVFQRALKLRSYFAYSVKDRER